MKSTKENFHIFRVFQYFRGFVVKNMKP